MAIPLGTPAPMGPGALPQGGTPLAMPTGNLGSMASAQAAVRQAIKLLEEALPKAGAESDLGKAIIDSIKKLAEKASPADENAGVDQAALRSIMQRAQTQAPLQAAMRAMAGAEQPTAVPPGGGAPMA